MSDLIVAIYKKEIKIMDLKNKLEANYAFGTGKRFQAGTQQRDT